MADIEVVIKIPEAAFEMLKEKVSMPSWIRNNILNAVASGTPLPEGHGRLIDADALETSYGLECATKYGNKSKEQQAHSYDTMMMYEIADMLDYAPTIIEADKQGAEHHNDDSIAILKAMQESADAVRNSPRYDFSCVTELLDEEEADKEVDE